MTSLLARCRIVVLAVVAGAGLPALWPAHATAQSGSEAPSSVVKAAFLFNFVKFTEWPGLEPQAPLVVCVVGDDTVADALVTTMATQTVGGHPLQLRRPDDVDAWPSCHLLFVAESEVRRLAGSLKQARQTPILTVSDARGFARDAGIVELFVRDNRMRFAINAGAAERAGLRISSRLLGLAEIVGGRP